MFPFFLKKMRLEKAREKAALFAGLVLVLLTGLLFISCDQPIGGDPGGVNAKVPNITGQPASATTWNVANDTTHTLTVTATVTDGGSLSYQWYNNTSNSTSGGSTIETGDATLSLAKTSYTSNGTYYFYVVVTNTNNSVSGNKTATATSSVATVTVSGNSGGSSANAQSPNITGQPASGTWNINVSATTTLTAAASVTDGGNLSYQWYSNTAASNNGGTVVSGGTSGTLTLSKTNYSTNGQRYFYVVVTNTNNNAAGNKTSATTSNVATVTVRGYLANWAAGTYYPENATFEEAMAYLVGLWDSGVGDGYLVRQWIDFSYSDQILVSSDGLTVDFNNPTTYDSRKVPTSAEYVIAYPYGWGFMGYMGLVRAINIFDRAGDNNPWYAVIIEYFEGGDPPWLSSTQGLQPGEKPYFGIYMQAYSQDQVGMANAVDLAALYAGDPYYTEQATLNAAINLNTKANRDAFIDQSVVMPQYRK